MSILINKSTRLLVQGITGRDGHFHAAKMKEYGTHVVGGTSPGKGGSTVDGLPVFNTMYEAVEKTQANASIIFVPANHAADAIMEAADAGIKLIICISEGIPTLDVIKAYRFTQLKGAMLIGPNCPGLISPEKSLAGILPGNVFKKGNIGVISRSGTLTYEYYLLKQKLAGKVDLIPLYHKDISKSHPFVIPEKGKPVKVYPWNVTLLCNTIVRHEGRVASVRGDTLYVGGKPVEAYTFNKNYYWMASNNPVNLCDSRLFGLVPDDHLIGKAWRIWFSSRKGRIFQRVQ